MRYNLYRTALLLLGVGPTSSRRFVWLVASSATIKTRTIPARNSCGRLLNYLPGSGSTMFVPGVDYDSTEVMEFLNGTSLVPRLPERVYAQNQHPRSEEMGLSQRKNPKQVVFLFVKTIKGYPGQKEPHSSLRPFESLRWEFNQLKYDVIRRRGGLCRRHKTPMQVFQSFGSFHVRVSFRDPKFMICNCNHENHQEERYPQK